MAGQGGSRVGAGAKKKSTQLKIVKGTFQPCRENPDQPEPSKDLPVAPSHLNDRAVYYFNLILSRLLDMDYASASHTEALSLLAMRLEESERHYTTLSACSYIFTTVDSFGNEVIKPRPEVALYKEAMRHAHTLLVDFGLTPSSMSRVNGKPKSKKADEWDEF